MKKGSILVNCARGGLVEEIAVAEAIKTKHLSAAAFDVFLEEPATSNPLFGLKNVICTPHLGASTAEAQEKVSFQIADQIINYLKKGAIVNALNAPSIDPKEALLLNPWIRLAKILGSFIGQILDSPILDIEIEYVGKVGELNFKPISSVLIAETLKPLVGSGVVNMVSAPLIARNKGIKISEIRRDTQGTYDSYIRVNINYKSSIFSIAGTIYSDGKPRIIQINSINLEAEPVDHMLYTTNIDKPGYIGALGTVLGEANVNIATFSLGRDNKNGKALALLGVDEFISDLVIKKIKKLPQVDIAKSLNFLK
jgi:D-3-phosphoglycerate dehydrogenase